MYHVEIKYENTNDEYCLIYSNGFSKLPTSTFGRYANTYPLIFALLGKIFGKNW